MTIHVKIENLDSRANAIVAVVTEDTYKTGGILSKYLKVVTHLRGGENVETYLTSSQDVHIVETRNDQ